MRKPIIAGNWKMNHTLETGTQLIHGLMETADQFPHIDTLICPPSFLLERAISLTQNTNIKVGAQNCHPEKKGAFTGEISANMLANLGCQFCIVGHSERRHIFNESNAFINQKVQACLQEKVIPILCVGETQNERDSGTTFSVIQAQLQEGLRNIDCHPTQLVIAYEPVWAIGTGNVATPQQAQDVHAFIREQLKGLYTPEFSQAIRIQYGGSVNPENIENLISQSDIDGALVGGACLTRDSFIQLLHHSQAYALG